MKDKILKNEITKKDFNNDEKILNYFRGYFNLYNVSDINAKYYSLKNLVFLCQIIYQRE